MSPTIEREGSCRFWSRANFEFRRGRLSFSRQACAKSRAISRYGSTRPELGALSLANRLGVSLRAGTLTRSSPFRFSDAPPPPQSFGGASSYALSDSAGRNVRLIVAQAGVPFGHEFPEPASSNMDTRQSSRVLLARLAGVLPQGHGFGIYHLSTPPTKTKALFHPPPDAHPDRTYCENHFLAVTINADRGNPSAGDGEDGAGKRAQVMVLALEVFIFTTAFSTIVFVSKADSTGYLQLLGLPKGTPSPIREVASTFVSYLLEQRRRKGIQSVISLFARAQSQYLFPGSVENAGKHVLDDRGLVRWWCRVLNPLLEEPCDRSPLQRRPWRDVHGYLIVPGLDVYETRAFLPRTASASNNWTVGHPLIEISHYSQEYDWVPPRSLIPRYPDDPKSRFRDELDLESSRWKEEMGTWKSVKTLDQFWEMMAFRQECSSGRLTGFIWVVFDPKDVPNSTSSSTQATTPSLLTPTASFSDSFPPNPPSTPPRRLLGPGATTPRSSPLKHAGTPGTVTQSPVKRSKPKKKALTGRIVPRQPRVKTHLSNKLAAQPVSTAYYYWPPEGRGERLVDEALYKRCTELLLHLDFATLEKGVNSTTRWISEVGMGAEWGFDIVGRRELPTQVVNGAGGRTVNNLSGLVKRKRAPEGSNEGGPNLGGEEPVGKINVLGAGLIRKKTAAATAANGKAVPVVETDQTMTDTPEEPKVNVLSAGLVRKRPKPS